MATIRIQDLCVVGSDLLFDEENYLNELINEEFDTTRGGVSPVVYTIAVGGAFVLSYNIGKIGAEVYNAIF